MPHVKGEDVAASLAGGADHVLLDLENGFRVVTLLAEDILLDESIKHVLEFASFMASIDDVPFGLDIELGLSAQFASEVLGDIGWGASECSGHVNHVDNDSLDAIPLALHFGLEPGHLVTIEGILNVPVYIQSHLETIFAMLRG